MPGAKGRTGIRKRCSEAAIAGEGVHLEPPADLCQKRRAIWNDLLGRLSHIRLADADVFLFRQLVELMLREEVLRNRLNFDPMDDTALRLSLQVWQQICRLSVVFGLSPVDRARMPVQQEEKEEDPADAWMHGGGLD